MVQRSRVALASEALRFFLEELLYMSSPSSAHRSTRIYLSVLYDDLRAITFQIGLRVIDFLYINRYTKNTCDCR